MKVITPGKIVPHKCCPPILNISLMILEVSLNLHNRAHCVTSSCVLYFSHNPKVPVDCWEHPFMWLAATVWCRATFLLKLSRFQLLSPQSVAFFQAASAAQTTTAKTNELHSIKWDPDHQIWSEGSLTLMWSFNLLIKWPDSCGMISQNHAPFYSISYRNIWLQPWRSVHFSALHTCK